MAKEISNEEIFEFMTKIYGEMQEGFKEIRGEVGGLKGEVGGLRGELGDLSGEVGGLRGELGDLKREVQENRNEIRKINVKIEHEISPKLDALFDGYKQNSDKLDRIEKEVSRHDEIILRRVR